MNVFACKGVPTLSVLQLSRLYFRVRLRSHPQAGNTPMKCNKTECKKMGTGEGDEWLKRPA